jgi:lipopolysaccharide export system protein LptA
MKNRPYSRPGAFLMLRLCLAAAAVGLLAVPHGRAQETASQSKGDPIRITADKLVTDNDKRSAQFSGNVKAVQENTVITTDRLTIFYKSEKSSSTTSQPNNNIEKLIAEGHVRIEFDNKVAVSNQAVYIISERKLVLSGPGSKVVSGQDEISGSRITFYRDDGRVALEGDGKERVKAIIHSDQGGLN